MEKMKSRLSDIQDLLNEKCSEHINTVFAKKPGWLLLKTKERNTTIGCVRANKNSFVTLYIDTNEGVLLEEKLLELDSFKGTLVDINSRQTGNFVQNKIKLFNENQINMIAESINKVFNDGIVKTGRRIRNSNKSKSTV